MSNQINGNSEPVNVPANDVTPEVISIARRWVGKAGLTAPVILTLQANHSLVKGLLLILLDGRLGCPLHVCRHPMHCRGVAPILGL
jgi:hypothetical protein